MKNIRYLISILCIIFVSACSTTINQPRLFPKHTGVHKRLIKLHNEFLYLAKQKGIVFKKPLTVGFVKIKRDLVVGTCYYGVNFREIDIDIDYWNNSSQLEKIGLLFHELIHCYCERDHDFENGKLYTSSNIVKNEEIDVIYLNDIENGRFDDNCAVSIMYPKTLSDYCLNKHYDEYINEMFNRCNPW